MNGLTKYLVLPNVRSEFEERYLARMNSIAAWFFAAHLPVFVLIAFLNGTGPLLTFALTSATLVGPLLAMNCLSSKRAVSTVMGVTAMFMGGLLVHIGQGPIQIEMHFYFFVLLALLAVFANPMVIIAAAVTAALHHAILWLILPASVFNYDAPFWVVAVHASFVVLESIAACFIARSFFDNVIGLEAIVAQRTAEAEARSRDIRRLFDVVQDGFFTINQQGIISEERSRATDSLLRGLMPDATLADVLREHDPTAADWLDLGLEDVFAGVLPVEVTISQLPSRVKIGAQVLSIVYRPVMDGTEVTELAITISDITAEVEREQLEIENREMLAMIERIGSDQDGTIEFLQEGDELIASLRDDAQTDMAATKRRLHTLKGNCSMFGLQRVSRTCHEIEDYLTDSGEFPPDVIWSRLFDGWSAARAMANKLVREDEIGIVLDHSELTSLLMSVLKNESKASLASRVANWRLEPTNIRLERVADHACRLAGRLGKASLRVITEHGDLRTEARHWAAFWSSIIHVVRNAIDHGIESADERTAKGKSENGTLRIKTAIDGDRFVVSIADDGRGIDWEKVRAVAKQHGQPAETHEDLVNAIFKDGVSTARMVTDTSGRGVGMSAIRHATEKLGGEISIHTQADEGAEFRFEFPLAAMAPETNSLLSRYGIKKALSLDFDDLTAPPLDLGSPAYSSATTLTV